MSFKHSTLNFQNMAFKALLSEQLFSTCFPKQRVFELALFGFMYLLLILLYHSTEAFLDCRASVSYNKEFLCFFITASSKISCSCNSSKDDVKKVYYVEINAASCFLFLSDIFPLRFLFSILARISFTKSRFLKN